MSYSASKCPIRDVKSEMSSKDTVGKSAAASTPSSPLEDHDTKEQAAPSIVRISFPTNVLKIDTIPLPVLVVLMVSMLFGKVSVPFPSTTKCAWVWFIRVSLTSLMCS